MESEQPTLADLERLARQAGEGDPGIGGPRQPRSAAHGEIVIGAEEGVEALTLGTHRHAELLVVGGTLLWFEKDSQTHLSIIAEDPAPCETAPRVSTWTHGPLPRPPLIPLEQWG